MSKESKKDALLRLHRDLRVLMFHLSIIPESNFGESVQITGMIAAKNAEMQAVMSSCEKVTKVSPTCDYVETTYKL
jgi:hypothetical protein